MVCTKGSLDMKHSFRNDRSGCHGVAQNRFQRIPVVNVPLNIRFDVRARGGVRDRLYRYRADI